MKKYSYAVLIPLMMAIIPLASCASSHKEPPDMMQDLSADEMYQQAEQQMKAGNYDAASKSFEELERIHPYSKLANEAQLLSAQATYEAGNYDEAILSLERFIQLHPGSDKIDYAYYLKALCYYEQISDVRRDQRTTQEALKALETVIKRFPDSQYSRDAAMKRDLAIDHLAGKEMEIGRYYLYKGQINAAIGRFNNVVKEYQTTTHAPEALYRLVESYLTLGIEPEALRVASVLGYNYPGSKWYERAYELLNDDQRKELIKNRSLFEKTMDSIL